MRALILVALSLAGMAWTASDAEARPWGSRGYYAAPAYYSSFSYPTYGSYYYTTPSYSYYPSYSSYYYPTYGSYYPAYSSGYYYGGPGYYSPSFTINSWGVGGRGWWVGW
jgi:hypothetical protein